jgi:hypothetical protein
MRKPNFFIAGAPRSGTTALFYFLKQHPEIYMSGLKEPYYFCSDFHEESDHFHQTELRFPIRTEKTYLKLFQDAVHEKTVGDATRDSLSLFETHGEKGLRIRQRCITIEQETIHVFRPQARMTRTKRQRLCRSFSAKLVIEILKSVDGDAIKRHHVTG